jgi:hypothetical protein
MKNLISSALLIMILICSCKDKTKDQIQVTSIDQLPGLWNWEYGGGGFAGSTVYSSKSNYATIEFTSAGKYIEKHNDTILFTADYSITKIDNVSASMTLSNFSGNPYPYQVNSTLTIMNNNLTIVYYELNSTYSKIK